MATWEDLLLEDMGRFVERNIKKPVTVIYYDYEDRSEGGCPTCGPDPAEVRITYEIDGSDKPPKTYWYYGSLGELLDKLRNHE